MQERLLLKLLIILHFLSIKSDKKINLIQSSFMSLKLKLKLAGLIISSIVVIFPVINRISNLKLRKERYINNIFFNS